MYFVYRFENDGTLTICTHTHSLINARELMLQQVHEFISENEGKKKISERELKTRPEDINELSVGYWFRPCSKDVIRLYFKTSKLNKGYFRETYDHNFEEVCYYSIVSYDKMSNSRGFTPEVVPTAKRIKPVPEQVSPQRRALLEEMKSSELFLRIKRACFVIPSDEDN